MIFTIESAKVQVEKLLYKYPDLAIVEMNDKIIHLHGTILVYRVLNDFPLRKSYILDIYIPLYSDILPYIIDSAKLIDPKYHHYYANGMLCLETDSKIRIRFINGFNLLEWMDEYVEPYFLSYEYYQLFGQFPNGERSHDILGVIESYQDMFHAKDIYETYQIMTHIKERPYRGHHKCPCESSLSIRKCHGEWILPFYKDVRIKAIMLNDLNKFEVALNETK